MTWAKYFAVFAITIVGCWYFHIKTCPTTPEAQRAFQQYHLKLKQYVQTEALENNAGQLKKLAAELSQVGFTSIRRDGK